MSSTRTFEGVLAGSPEPTTLDGDHGIVFWVRTARPPRDEAAQVFLSASRADQVDHVDLRPGTAIAVEGVLRADGVTVATLLRPTTRAPHPPGQLVGTVHVVVPPLARLDPWRERGYRLGLYGGLAVVLALGLVGMSRVEWVGNLAFILFLLVCAWLVWQDLHTRKVDEREYTRLAATVTEAVRAQLDVAVPPLAMFTALGGGLERTGNPWRPMRPRRPQPVTWVEDVLRLRLALDVSPKPLRPGSPATITVSSLGPIAAAAH